MGAYKRKMGINLGGPLLGLFGLTSCGPVVPEADIDAIMEIYDSGEVNSSTGLVYYNAEVSGKGKCVVCHATNGKSSQNLTVLTPRQIASGVRNGNGSMPSYSRVELTDQQVADLIAYIVTLPE